MQPRQTKLEARRGTSGPPIIPGWVWRGGWVDDSVPSERIVARSVRVIDRDETLFHRKELSRLFRFRVEYEKGHKRNLWFDYRDINLMQISVANSFYSTSNFFPPRISIQLKLDASSLFRVFVRRYTHTSRYRDNENEFTTKQHLSLSPRTRETRLNFLPFARKFETLIYVCIYICMWPAFNNSQRWNFYWILFASTNNSHLRDTIIEKKRRGKNIPIPSTRKERVVRFRDIS